MLNIVQILIHFKSKSDARRNGKRKVVVVCSWKHIIEGVSLELDSQVNAGSLAGPVMCR